MHPNKNILHGLEERSFRYTDDIHTDRTKRMHHATGASDYRHQIRDGTGREAHHPLEILYNALID
jgi:hypothetical protein